MTKALQSLTHVIQSDDLPVEFPVRERGVSLSLLQLLLEFIDRLLQHLCSVFGLQKKQQHTGKVEFHPRNKK